MHTASATASGGERYWPKVIRKAPVLPITFLGGGSGRVGGDRGLGDGCYSVVGSVRGVTGNVGGCGGVTGGAGGGVVNSISGSGPSVEEKRIIPLLRSRDVI